tara:strand:+ start:83 stop:733 length:651 start_codon:yes stop_codon:yes gene_type:complete
MGAAVPFAGATMTGFGGAAATAAATTAATTIASSFVPTLLTQSTGIPMGGGGFFGNLGGGLLSGIGPMDAVFGITQGLSALQGIKQGQILKDQYKMQQLTTLADMENKKLNWELDNIKRLKKLQAINAANITKSYARGVEGLDSSKILNTLNEQEYGEDYKTGLLNYQNILVEGKTNANIYGDASSRAISDSVLNSGIKLGEAAYLYSKIGKAPTS